MRSLLSTALLAMLVALSGCSTMEQHDSSTLYLDGGETVHPQREFLDRYACATGTPLMCNCASRLSGSCVCGC